MHINFVSVLVAALIPMALGFVWYNSKVFGTAWMAASGMTPEKAKAVNMRVMFGLSFVLAFMLAFGLQFMVIHQFHVNSLFYMQPIDDATTEAGALYKTIMDQYGTSFRTFKHGALHGTIGGFFIALPILGTNALFEGKGFKYIAINCGYWIICLGLMGGVLSAFA
ncbi:MAG: DUF1761 domain-containing protein [Bacteroidota bacterium]|nr:DUF1761 domain-containing protein [Bacteroidota bacterium]MDP3145930.1 DUF1761 domain-containing protein [Bacteroidota bacterium]MDP3558565.1 DUF1761 domain-containing protein [Bacteroidota bacterium]